MLVANRKQRLFVGASLDFDKELRKFVVAAQLESSLWTGRNTSKFLLIFEPFTMFRLG
jgi:hypothetical protein